MPDTTTYTLCIFPGELPRSTEALVRRAIPAGIDGPFTGTVALDVDGVTPAQLAERALELLRLTGDFAPDGEPTMFAGYDGLHLEYRLTH